MTVYVLEAHVRHEGFDIEGVYSTMELAQAALADKQKNKGLFVDWYDIEEFEVDA